MELPRMVRTWTEVSHINPATGKVAVATTGIDERGIHWPVSIEFIPLADLVRRSTEA